MPGWVMWLLVGLLAWGLLALLFSLLFGRFLRLSAAVPAAVETESGAAEVVVAHLAPAAGESTVRSRRILIVDDDPALRSLLHATLTAEFEVAEAEDAKQASDLARFWCPSVVLLDVAMPGLDGLAFCSDLKRKPVYGKPLVVLLTGTEIGEEEAHGVGADALLRKPFSPLELVSVVDRLSGADGIETGTELADRRDDQALLYARDLSRLLEIERVQRRVLKDAYRETVAALANALEAKDTGTGRHCLRVRHYAADLTAAVEPALLHDPSLEYGFLLHDVGKIGVPNELLEKQGPLSPREMELMRLHTVIGAEILGGVTFLQGEGLKVIRSHHEHWDGSGYPDGLAGEAIPFSARIFSVADALDAMTGKRPYRLPVSWDAAAKEISSQSGRQFDPAVVEVFFEKKDDLRRLFELTPAA